MSGQALTRSPILTGDVRAWRRARLAGAKAVDIARDAGRDANLVSAYTGRLARPSWVAVLHRHGACLDDLQRICGVTAREAVALIRADGGLA